MSDPASTAQRQQAHQQSGLVAIITLPFRLFGVLCGSLLLSILIECVGLHLLWPEQGWRHAQDMLDHELAQFSVNFTQSIWLQEPGCTARWLIEGAYEVLFVQSGLLDWIEDTTTHTRHPAKELRAYLWQTAGLLQNYLIAATYSVLVFMVRLLVLCLTLPLFVLAAFVGLVDGLVRRDIRRFGAGRESGFVYHRAKAMLMPLAVLPWVIYLALPVSVDPLLILLPSAVLLGMAVDVTAGSFKKHL